MSFADNLKSIRKTRNISQEVLAEMMNVSRQAVSKWEQDDGYPEVEKLLLLSEKLNVSLDDLMQGEMKDIEHQEQDYLVSLLQVDAIELMFGEDIIPLVKTSLGGNLTERISLIRKQIAMEYGYIIPKVRLRDHIQLKPNQYKIIIKGKSVGDGEVLLNHYLAIDSGEVQEEVEGILTNDPVFCLPAYWITEKQCNPAKVSGYTVVEPASIIATHLLEEIRKHLSELITRQDVHSLLQNVKKSNPDLISELIPTIFTVGEVHQILKNLMKEGNTIRDLSAILEILAEYAPSTKDLDVLTEYVKKTMEGQ